MASIAFCQRLPEGKHDSRLPENRSIPRSPEKRLSLADFGTGARAFATGWRWR